MALEPFATARQMADRSQGAIPTDHPFLATELKAATRHIRNACGWHIAKAAQLRYRKVRPFSEAVWLPAMQIQSIDSGTIDGTKILAPAEFDPEIGWTALYGRNIDLTFTAGYAEVPEDLVTLTLELAAGALGSPLGISREQAGTVSVSYTRTSGELTAADHDRLAAYKLGRLP